jgi:hypothetical protein
MIDLAALPDLLFPGLSITLQEWCSPDQNANTIQIPVVPPRHDDSVRAGLDRVGRARPVPARSFAGHLGPADQ